MHTLECDDWRVWWPQGAPAELDISTLSSVANNITNPVRLGGDGEGKWLGVWGNFQGYRLASSPRESFQVMSGSAIPYPFGADLYESIDVGGSGVRSIARFLTREAALNWAGTRNSAPTRVVPLPAATNFSYGADGIADPTVLPGNAAFGYVQNDRTGNVDRIRQPDSFVAQSVQNLAISVASTGVKSTLTLSQDAQLLNAWFDASTAFSGTASILQLRVTRAGNTTLIAAVQPPAAVAVGDVFAPSRTASALTATQVAGPALFPANLVAGDVVDWNVSGSATAGAANFHIDVKRQRAAF